MRRIAKWALAPWKLDRIEIAALALLLASALVLLGPAVAIGQQGGESQGSDAAAGEEAEPEEDKQVKPAPPRPEGEGEGPFERLIIRGVTMIDGTGSPPYGPVDIVVEGNRIAEIETAGTPGLPMKDMEDRPGDAEIDATGWYVMPGIVDLHAHTGGVPKAPEAEYVYKLWMAHGVTTARGVPTGPLEWSLSERERSAANEITAPRIVSYHRM